MQKTLLFSLLKEVKNAHKRWYYHVFGIWFPMYYCHQQHTYKPKVHFSRTIFIWKFTFRALKNPRKHWYYHILLKFLINIIRLGIAWRGNFFPFLMQKRVIISPIKMTKNVGTTTFLAIHSLWVLPITTLHFQ